MKALFTLALVTAGLMLSSCAACKNGKCPFSFKKKAPEACATCCDAKPGASKTAHKH
jgi:hypothetical protein